MPLGATSLIFASVVLAAGTGISVFYPMASAQVRSSSPAPRYYGVNLPSGSFGPRRKPGVHGKDYIYPTRKAAQPFRAMGMNTVRLAFLWERLQPEANGPLDPDELKRLNKSINDLDGFGTVVLNVHNYARYRGVTLDKPERSGAMLADLWSKLGREYKGNPRIAFGIMNEPHGIDIHEWRKISEQTVSAIRNTGATNLVLVPGTRWTGGHSWNKGGPRSNAVVMKGLSDPAGNLAYEIHQYLDSDSSGTKGDCVSANIGEQRLAGVTRWLRQERAKGFLAEFGVTSSPVCLAALDNMLEYMRANGDVWIGWTYWAGGDWWGDYPFSIQPEDGRPKPQSEVLQRHIATYRRAAAK